MIHGYIILWFGDILFAYGLYGLFLFPFRTTSPKKLIVAAGVLTLIGVALSSYGYSKNMKHLEQYTMAQTYADEADIPEDIKKGKEAWEEMVAEMKTPEKEVQENTENMHKGYFVLVLFLAPVNCLMQSTFNYDYNPWDILAMMLLGIALYKLRVITAELSYKSYLIMMVVGYAIGLSVNYYETMLILKDALAAVGRMALTNYIMHSVICAIIFTGVGFSMFGKLQRYELYYVVIFIWIFQLIVSPIWLKYFRFGPLEWIWRTLAYKQMQPFKRQIPK